MHREVSKTRSVMCTGSACPSPGVGEDKVAAQQSWVPAFIGGRVALHTFRTMLNFVADRQGQWATHFYLLWLAFRPVMKHLFFFFNPLNLLKCLGKKTFSMDRCYSLPSLPQCRAWCQIQPHKNQGDVGVDNTLFDSAAGSADTKPRSIHFKQHTGWTWLALKTESSTYKDMFSIRQAFCH